MSLVSILVLLIGGSVAGFLAGFFAVGGGILLVPVLLMYYHWIGVSSLISTHLAFGTSLLVIVFSSSSTAYQYNKTSSIIWPLAMAMGGGSIIGGTCGSLFAGTLPEETLKRIFAVLVLLAAVGLFAERTKPKGQSQPPLLLMRAGVAGVGVGLMSSLAGVGGGTLAVPVLYSLFHLPLKKAMGTSSATIAVAAASSVIGYGATGFGNSLLPWGAVGYVDVIRALPLVAASVPMARVGVAVAERTKAPLLRKLFATLLLVMGIRMLIVP
jgi:uncharacterized membrane protein YfcA